MTVIKVFKGQDLHDGKCSVLLDTQITEHNFGLENVHTVHFVEDNKHMFLVQ